ncbi:hypothetical protein INR49_007414 [Caranx melampygus]|nr:hypothetical protein INR49_007414 [Caranx melampygus]
MKDESVGVADFLKQYGVINAINLDGGVNKTRWRCARRVSTILCIHQRHCDPSDCSGHGDCVDGRCRCQARWTGPGCDSLLCRPPACGPPASAPLYVRASV